MLDKRGKLFGKISIVDILIVCIVVVMAAGAFMSIKKISDNVILTENKGLVSNSATDTLEVTFRLEEVRSMTFDAISEGDDVYMADTGKYLGTVISTTNQPSKRMIYDNYGRSILADVPERMDVFMTVSVPGKRLQDGYFTADNIHLALDSKCKIKTPKIQTSPYIHEIKTVTSE